MRTALSPVDAVERAEAAYARADEIVEQDLNSIRLRR